jgi:hypothetical protein
MSQTQEKVLPGGFKLDDVVYSKFVQTGLSSHVSCGELGAVTITMPDLTYGERGVVTGVRGKTLLWVKFDKAGKWYVHPELLSKEMIPKDLPHGFKLYDVVYSKWFDSGSSSDITYGERGVVTGVWGKYLGKYLVCVKFEKAGLKTVYPEVLSKEMVPKDMPGGFKLNDVIYSNLFLSGTKSDLTYGQRGVVTGLWGKTLSVKFDKAEKWYVHPEVLSKEMAAKDLPGGFKLHDVVYYKKFQSGTPDVTSGERGIVSGVWGKTLVYVKFEKAGYKHVCPKSISKEAGKGIPAIKDDEKKDEKWTDAVIWRFCAVPKYRTQPSVWDSAHPFEDKTGYVGIVDRKAKTCYVESLSYFNTNDYGTCHKNMMEALNLWQEYQSWTQKPGYYLSELESFAGFIRVARQWRPNSCTLNVAHTSNMDQETVFAAIKVSGLLGMDEYAKARGMDVMKDTIWNNLKKQLEAITK